MKDELFFGEHPRKRSIPANASFRITDKGRDEMLDLRGDTRCRVLTALETVESSTAKQIASASGLRLAQVERVIPGLTKSRCIQRTDNTDKL